MAWIELLLITGMALLHAWRVHRSRRSEPTGSSHAPGLRGDLFSPLVRTPRRLGSMTHRASESRRPLRVVCLRDSDLQPGRAGRMRISGRMADVCAELDRLAALEDATCRS